MQPILLQSLALKTSRLLLLLISLLPGSLIAQMRITEFMYSGSNGEFVEFTNIGSAAIDMTGWSFDDATRSPGAHNLSGFGIVMPGESVVVTETSPVSAFRSAWNICAGTKIVGGYTNDNLGRSDEINLYDASQLLVDRLTFNDQGSGGGPRTQNKSAWVKAAGLGANIPAQWTLSAVNDSEGSFASSGGDIGSPGKSTRATVAFNPCVVANGSPTISINTSTTSDLLDGGLLASPAGSFSISGVIDDPSDPAAHAGIDFIIGDDATAADNLIVTASSSNTNIVANANILLTGSGSGRNIKITPSAVGYTNISVSVSDGNSSTSYLLSYAASAASAQPSNTSWHTGISDASDAIALGDDYFITGDDEQDVLNVYSRVASGLPLTTFNYASLLNLPDPSKPETDIEAATKSSRDTAKIYWLGSMSNGKSPFSSKPNRDRLFATVVTGTGSTTSFTFSGYVAIKNALLSWGDAHGYGFTASAASGVDSKAVDGLAAEGMAFGPDSIILYIGLRAPLVPTVSRTKAVIAPLLDFENWFNNGSPAADPSFGNPIELDLGGRGIRDIIRLPTGVYILIAGSSDESLNPALYKWSGRSGDSPVLLSAPDIASLNIEGGLPIRSNNGSLQPQLEVITDMGGDILYNDGIEAKSLGENNYKKFRSDIISNLNLELLSVKITSPVTGAVFQIGDPITVNADTKGEATRVAFFEHADKITETSAIPFTLTAQDVDPGTYLVTARAYNQQGDSAVSDTVRITIAGCTGSGTISAEGFTDIAGTKLINLASSAKYPNDPDITASLNHFEYGPNIGDNYGARVRGYICAPATGNYVFYLSSDEQSQLFLSDNDDPQNIQRIAYVDGKTGFRNWFINPGQRSVPIRLVKGHRYYVETIHKEGTGTDHLSVGWVIPGGVFEAPIPGNRLSPFRSSDNQTAPAGFADQMLNVQQAIKAFTINAYPVPAIGRINLSIQSKNNHIVTIKVIEATGRIIETLRTPANSTIRFGEKYPSGVYFITGQQEDQIIRLKIIKQ